jgi:acyl-coenzyme A synthetase/AMP-(fatty) acid ligase
MNSAESGPEVDRKNPIAERFAGHKQPKKIIFVDELPRNAAGQGAERPAATALFDL